jgi:hypothetical protein
MRPVTYSLATDGVMRFLTLRAVFLFGFVVAMPVLALPPVARQIDRLLYGAPPTDFGRPPAAPPLPQEPAAHHSNPIAQASYNEPSPAPASALASPEGPPQLAATPQFDPPAPAVSPLLPEPERRIDDQAIARLQRIRERLEQLGAEYVLVESLEGGRYRFHCRMVIDERSRFTKPFEVASFDPVAAGEQVLQSVESWRVAARDR